MDTNEMQSVAAQWFAELADAIARWAQSPAFYIQLAAIGIAIALAFVATLAVSRSALFREPAESARFRAARRRISSLKATLFPLFAVFALAIAARVSGSMGYPPWVIRVAEGAALVYLLYLLITRYIPNAFIRGMGRWIGIPVATLAVFGWLDEVTGFLDSISLSVGNIHLSLYALARAFIFGALLFWMGRISNVAGKEAIRKQEQMDLGTREVVAKLYEIALFVLIFLLLLQIMGISLTALAVFGGALGVGLGFGLQQIASNFISGIIILLDRSLSIGDHIELEDGRAGALRELNMRFGVLETFDGKDIVVPNEQFITSSYTNWTHKDPQQRYAIEFQVAYATDLDALFVDLRKLCADHPQVLSGPNWATEYQPDAEISGFGDSGIDILVEYWMEGVDDGKNRVDADLKLAIYHLFRDSDYEFPFPQREVRVLGEQPTRPGPG